MIATGDWQDFTFTVELPSSNLAFSNVQLVDDTETPGDLVTSDPRVAGTVSWDMGSTTYQVSLEFDHDADGSQDGSTTIWSPGSSFTYDPRNYGLASSYGPFGKKCNIVI